MADRWGTGVLAVAGAADDVAALVDRPATAARLETGEGGVPGSGHAVQEPRAGAADELAGRADNASLSRLWPLVKRLEERGLVRREPDPADGRFTHAILTEDGFQILAEAAPGHVA